MSALVSIVVPCHDNLRYTALCLDSVARHTPQPHEVIVVDNGCTDATAEWAQAHGARVVRSRVNLGLAGGVNLGPAAAAGDVAVLLNNDALATPGRLAGLLGALGPRGRRRHRRPPLELGVRGLRPARPPLRREVGPADARRRRAPRARGRRGGRPGGGPATPPPSSWWWGPRARAPPLSAVLGSVSAALVRSAPCPVVVVPPTAADDQDGVWGIAPERSHPAAAVPARHAAS